jgi:glycosyltransferase involved in cell wall biosynthesis
MVNCFFNTSIDLTIFGGARTHTIEKISTFARIKGIKAYLICVKKDKKIDLNFSCYCPFFPFWRGFFYQFIFELWSIFFSFVFKIKYKNSIMFLRYRPLVFISMVFCKYMGWKIVFEPNDNVIQQLKLYGKYKGLYKLLVDFCLYKCFNKADYVICHSEKIKKWVESYNIKNSEKLIISSMGANPDIFYPKDSKEAKKKLRFLESDIIFLDTGTFTPWGGADLLISAMNILKNRNKIENKYLLLTGTGSNKEKLINQTEKFGLKNNVIFYNGIAYEKVPDFINAADLCFCLKKEFLDVTSPNRLFEYIFCNKPVALTKEYKIFFPLFKGLIFVSSYDANEVADIMENFMSIVDYKLILHDYNIAITEYSWNSIVKKLIRNLKLQCVE